VHRGFLSVKKKGRMHRAGAATRRAGKMRALREKGVRVVALGAFMFSSAARENGGQPAHLSRPQDSGAAPLRNEVRV
jgi:hypothetical protein